MIAYAKKREGNIRKVKVSARISRRNMDDYHVGLSMLMTQRRICTENGSDAR